MQTNRRRVPESVSLVPISRWGGERLLQRLDRVVERDRKNTCQLLIVLAEVDERKLWAELGFSSMFGFCQARYAMSEAMIQKRLWAARTARRFPVILRMVERGDLHLTGISKLAAHLTKENHGEVLQQAKRKSVREIEVLVREISPLPDAKSMVRALPGPKTESEAAPDLFTPAPKLKEPYAPRPVARRKYTEPLSPQRYLLRVTLDQRSRDDLRALQELLAHKVPSGDPAEIVARALSLLRAETLKKKAAIVEAPRSSSKAPTVPVGRTIPASVRRHVWSRDEGKCQFRGVDGHIWGEKRMVEFHHKTPFAPPSPH